MRLRFRSTLLVLSLSAASAALAIPVNTTKLINGSRYPVLGLELVTLEANDPMPKTRTPIFLDQPLLPGEMTTITESVDEALLARGGQQQLRWYWTSDRACWGYLVASPKGGPGGANTGDSVCQGGRTPEPPAILLAARLQTVDAIAERGDVAGAIFEINALMAEYPGLSPLLHRRGELYLQYGYGNPVRAEQDFRAETGVDAGHSFHDLAMVFFARGEGRRALELLSSAVQHSPDNMQYRNDRAQLSCVAGDFEQMREDEAAIVALGGPQLPPRAADCSFVESGW